MKSRCDVLGHSDFHFLLQFILMSPVKYQFTLNSHLPAVTNPVFCIFFFFSKTPQCNCLFLPSLPIIHITMSNRQFSALIVTDLMAARDIVFKFLLLETLSSLRVLEWFLLVLLTSKHRCAPTPVLEPLIFSIICHFFRNLIQSHSFKHQLYMESSKMYVFNPNSLINSRIIDSFCR